MTSSMVRFALSILVIGATACASGPATGHPGVDQAPAPADDLREDALVKLLRGRAHGLNVTRTASGELAVQLIRGPTSFYGSNTPLYLVDDAPYTPGPGGALVGINPYDIESIQALTKPEETGFYGSRGANGVIVITLKKAGKAQ
jgi:TonB-dependent SusC/RagA subfamily outer membrane receptor